MKTYKNNKKDKKSPKTIFLIHLKFNVNNLVNGKGGTIIFQINVLLYIMCII